MRSHAKLWQLNWIEFSIPYNDELQRKCRKYWKAKNWYFEGHAQAQIVSQPGKAFTKLCTEFTWIQNDVMRATTRCNNSNVCERGREWHRGRRMKHTREQWFGVYLRVTGCQKFNIEKSKIVMANYVQYFMFVRVWCTNDFYDWCLVGSKQIPDENFVCMPASSE